MTKMKIINGKVIMMEVFAVCLLLNSAFPQPTSSKIETAASATIQNKSAETLIVGKCADFPVTGNGSNPQWDKAEWSVLTKIDKGGRNYESKFKILASTSGIYILFYGEDDKITTKEYKDFDKIWNGDVFEVFFHPSPKEPMYYEYEVNQFGKQIVLAISNSKSGLSWVPFNEYDNNKFGIENKVEISGGPAALDSHIKSWSAEVFLSYKSIGLMPNVPPRSGTVWNANFCRLDHDTGKMIKWSWSPSIERSLHELDKFRSIKFQ